MYDLAATEGLGAAGGGGRRLRPIVGGVTAATGFKEVMRNAGYSTRICCFVEAGREVEVLRERGADSQKGSIGR